MNLKAEANDKKKERAKKMKWNGRNRERGRTQEKKQNLLSIFSDCSLSQQIPGIEDTLSVLPYGSGMDLL